VHGVLGAAPGCGTPVPFVEGAVNGPAPDCPSLLGDTAGKVHIETDFCTQGLSGIITHTLQARPFHGSDHTAVARCGQMCGQCHRSWTAEIVLNEIPRGLAKRQLDIVEPKSARRTLAKWAPISGGYFKKATEHDKFFAV